MIRHSLARYVYCWLVGDIIVKNKWKQLKRHSSDTKNGLQMCTITYLWMLLVQRRHVVMSLYQMTMSIHST